jgi:hypothetical protein
MGGLREKKILSMHRKMCVNAYFLVHVFLRYVICLIRISGL